LRLEEKQAAAATGQVQLAHAYQEALALHDITVALVLLTPDDTESRRRHLNARNTIDQLLKLKVVPVINENDTITTAEIRFGDNDRLAARVAQMICADVLVLLSDIDGLYTGDPRKNPAARHIPEIHELTPEIESMAGEALSNYSSGGMVTKLAAARICMNAGCHMVIARGVELHALRLLDERARCSWFIPAAEPRTARKRWIAGSIQLVGTFVIDDGAVIALAAGKSLLPAGIMAVEGEFHRGDAVMIRTRDGRILGCGLSAYSSADARRICGHRSAEIESLLGWRGRDEMIHRDDLAVG
jgi:glutamate 5-kinase